MKKVLSFMATILIFCCCATQFNRPQWSATGGGMLTALNRGPWVVDPAPKDPRGVIELVEMGASFDHNKVNQLNLYINGGIGTESIQFNLEKVPDYPQLWSYKYYDIINELIEADLDTTRGKCQGVLEVHYKKDAMVFYVAPCYLGFNNTLKTIELLP
ncbi:hypothetical protein JW998_07760 [candidate division KSB1 bacterium]|nr:hypothetical protein [candidate division KSB1 bacterium]